MCLYEGPVYRESEGVM